MTDKTLGACQCHEKHAPAYWKGVVREYKDALDKAEQERDEARANAYNWEATAEEWEKRAVRAESHPLTPDAIEVALHDCMPSVALDRLSGTQVMRLAEDMHVALTEPPARPEGAEDIEAYMRELVASHPEDHYGELADHLASRGVLPPLTDKTNPARVVTEEMNR